MFVKCSSQYFQFDDKTAPKRNNTINLFHVVTFEPESVNENGWGDAIRFTCVNGSVWWFYKDRSLREADLARIEQLVVNP